MLSEAISSASELPTMASPTPPPSGSFFGYWHVPNSAADVALRASTANQQVADMARTVQVEGCGGKQLQIFTPLSVLGTPVKVGVRCHFWCWPSSLPGLAGRWAQRGGQGGAPAAQRGRTTLTPAPGPPHAGARVDEAKALRFKPCDASACSR